MSQPAKKKFGLILKRAKAAGGTLSDLPKQEEWGYAGYFKDLDGHLWEIIWNPAFGVES